MKDLEVGDPVTVYIHGIIARTTVTEDWHGGLIAGNVMDMRYLHPKQENLSWLRGHHADDSDEVKALLVAQALLR